MPSRLFHCEISNAGNGPLFCISGILDHGDWSDGYKPWESAKVIGPGETKAFQSESSGVMTGTEGHATFRTLAFGSGEDAAHADFLKVYWDLPYFKLDASGIAQTTVIEKHRFDPDMPHDTFEWDGRDQRPASISTKAYVSPAPVDFAEQIQNFPELFVGGLATPFLAPFEGQINVPDHVYCYLSVEGSVAVNETPHTVPGFSKDKAVPPVPAPLKESSRDQWVGTWESNHITTVIAATGDALDVTVQEQRQTGQYTIKGNGVRIEQVKLHPYTVTEQAVGAAAAQGTHGSSKLNVGVGVAGTVAQHQSNTKLGVEQGASIIGDYISLPEDTTIEIYRLMSGNTMVGQALKYRRPTSRVVSLTENFDEFLYRKPNIG